MSGLLDILSPVRTRAVPHAEITTQSALRTYQIPPDGSQPRTYVYFDVLRPATCSSQQLLANARFSLEAVPAGNEFATIRAGQRLDRFFKNIWNYVVPVGADSTVLPLFAARPAMPTDANAKMDYLNALLANYRSSLSVDDQTAGPSTMSLTFSYPRPIGRTKSPQDLPRDVSDLDLLWAHLSGSLTSGFTVSATGPFTALDQPLFGPNTWVYAISKARNDPNKWEFIFTGLVTSCVRQNERGFVSVNVVCEDVSKFLHKTQMRINPAFADPAATDIGDILGTNFTIFNHMLAGLDLEAIYRMLILGEDQNGGKTAAAPLGVLDYTLASELSDIQSIYQQQIVRPLQTPAVDALSEFLWLGSEMRRIRHDPVLSSRLVMWGVNDLVPYRAMLPTRTPSLFTCDTVNRLDACREAAQRSMIEFYAGTDGNFHVHPYRHASYFLTAHAQVGGNPVEDVADRWDGSFGHTDAYVIDEDEILADTESVSDDEIVTVLSFTGETALTGPVTGDRLSKRVGVTGPDYLVSRFGFWYREIVEPLVNSADKDLLTLFALARMAFINKDAYSGQFTILHRPEIRKARPVYFPSRNNVGYVTAVTHSPQPRGQMVTRLSVTFLRKTNAKVVDFTEWMIQTNRRIDSFDPATVATLVTDFKAAAGFEAGTGSGPDSISFDPSQPGSGTGSPTTFALNKALGSANQGNLSATEEQKQLAEVLQREELLRSIGGASP